MKTRDIGKTFDLIKNLGYKNLLVSGCSFTYNNSEEHSVTWPYYLKDFCGFETVYDCSLPGAGNYHILQSNMWTIENKNLNPEDTLVIVMWSGFFRDDFIINYDMLDDYPFVFNYTKNTSSAISNSIAGSDDLKQYKSEESRAIENFLYINSLSNYLQNKKFKFLFFNYLDYTLPNRSGEKDIVDFLPQDIQTKLDKIIDNNIENIYRFSLKNNLLDSDDFHPSPDGHMQWTKKHLVPYLLDNFCNSNS